MALLKRLARHELPTVPFTLDGVAYRGHSGDTVLTAVLTVTDKLRSSDFSGTPRAGFCHMGACQDCWILTSDGRRLRACGTPLEPGMNLLTRTEGRS